jgi:hypothetical protein
MKVVTENVKRKNGTRKLESDFTCSAKKNKKRSEGSNN